MQRPLFLLAPGAGAPSLHPWMQRWKQRLESLGRVAVFDYAYMREGKRRPDPMAQLVAAHRQALAENCRPEESVILIGKSMGGRMGCHLSLQEQVNGLVCLGYPLCGGGNPNKLRDQILRELTTPILFVQGTRDPLCPLNLLEPVRAQMNAPNELHLVDGGDHSLMVRKGDLKQMGKTQEDIDERILDAIAVFVESAGSGRSPTHLGR
jgi:predicted alpha/beta-hydrolase family hydrolase